MKKNENKPRRWMLLWKPIMGCKTLTGINNPML